MVFIGNDEIFALSNQRRSMLRIDLFDFADNDGFATYDDFYIDDEKEGYKLHIGDYRGNIGKKTLIVFYTLKSKADRLRHRASQNVVYILKINFK